MGKGSIWFPASTVQWFQNYDKRSKGEEIYRGLALIRMKINDSNLAAAFMWTTLLPNLFAQNPFRAKS